jgi:hypothetical protein
MMLRIFISILFVISNYSYATIEPDIQIDTGLVETSLALVNQGLSDAERKTALSDYMSSEYIQLAFKRYSDSSRPAENRITDLQFKSFIFKIWENNFNNTTIPRVNLIKEHYLWAWNNFKLIQDATNVVESNIQQIINKSMNTIPFGTPAATIDSKKIKIIFLADPGGSYPWVYENEEYKFIYIDILQLRGSRNIDKDQPFSQKSFQGFLTHELYHLFQNDINEMSTYSDWLLIAAVSEGAAMLIGNNAFGRDGITFFPKEKTTLSGSPLREWSGRMKNIDKRIQSYIKLYNRWENNEPSLEELQQVIVDDAWIASQSNGLLFGDIYRVGAQMLLDIKNSLGLQKMYQVCANSKLLIPTWILSQKR